VPKWHLLHLFLTNEYKHQQEVTMRQIKLENGWDKGLIRMYSHKFGNSNDVYELFFCEVMESVGKYSDIRIAPFNYDVIKNVDVICDGKNYQVKAHMYDKFINVMVEAFRVYQSSPGKIDIKSPACLFNDSKEDEFIVLSRPFDDETKSTGSVVISKSETIYQSAHEIFDKGYKHDLRLNLEDINNLHGIEGGRFYVDKFFHNYLNPRRKFKRLMLKVPVEGVIIKYYHGNGKPTVNKF